MKEPTRVHDVVSDDRRKLLLDMIELLSDGIILGRRQATRPVFELRWLRNVLLVPYVCPHVMESVVGLLLTASRLLDTGELC